MSELKKIEDGKVEITVVIEGDEWEEAKKKAFKKVINKLQIKGFRKGQVPANLAKKYVSDKEIEAEAASEKANDKFEAAVKEHEIELIDRASLDFKEIDDKHVTLLFTCPVKPDVKLGDYKSLKYNLEEVNVEDKDIDEEIEKTLQQKADLELKEDGYVENGDTAVIDFEGFKDGVAFDGGKGENYDLVIGSGSFIPGFEEQLIGMKAEEEKDINVSFPENYHVEDLKGQPVVFKVKVHEIKKKVLPTLDDEFVKELKIEGIETVDAYKSMIKENLLKRKQNAAENKANDELIKSFADLCEVNVPEVMIKQEVEEIMNEQAQRLMYQGISMEQYQKIIGQNADEMKKALEPTALERVKTSLCLEKLAKEEKIEASEEDVNKQFEDMAKTYSMEIDEVKKYISVESIKNGLKIQKAIDFLKNNK